MIKKGQITMESLLLYGLAILVVLLAIGALTFFGVLDLGRALPDRCTLTGSGSLDCVEWSISKQASAPSTVSLGLKNVGTSQVVISSAVLKVEGSNAVCTLSVVSVPIEAGSNGLVPMNCAIGAVAYQFPQNVGQKVRGEIELVYAGQIITTNRVSGSLVATLTS